jgi:hypothetical protein
MQASLSFHQSTNLQSQRDQFLRAVVLSMLLFQTPRTHLPGGKRPWGSRGPWRVTAAELQVPPLIITGNRGGPQRNVVSRVVWFPTSPCANATARAHEKNARRVGLGNPSLPVEPSETGVRALVCLSRLCSSLRVASSSSQRTQKETHPPLPTSLALARRTRLLSAQQIHRPAVRTQFLPRHT